MVRIAVTSRSFSRHPALRAELLARYDQVTFNDEGISLSGDNLIAFLRGHDRAITALERISAPVLSALPELKVIAKFGVGLDMIDMDAMRRHEVRLGWTGGVNRRAVTELVLSAMISLLRHVPKSHLAARLGHWQQIVGRQLTGKVVGIVGCGHIGKDLSIILKAFGCTVLAHDILDFPEFYATHGIEAVDMDELLECSDIVTLHLPLNESTQGFLSAERLVRMRPGALLINAARGGLVDEATAKRMLMAGHLGGAYFDVLAEEPPTDMELIRLPNVLVTPHLGGSAEEAVLAMGRAAIDGLENHQRVT